MKLTALAIFFALTACLYASVGFGGGSTYTALLVLSGADYALIPIIALACNIAVVSGNTVRYSRRNLIPWKQLWPLLIASVPMAWVGGRITISEILFISLLAAALFIAGVRQLLKSAPEPSKPLTSLPVWKSMLIGGSIGIYSGMVGIGGGIFLAPVLYALNWGRAKTIAAACSVFILFNSVSGFAGQFMKLSDTSRISEALAWWPLIPAVLAGGFIGNYVGVMRLSQIWVQRLTGVLILTVAIRLSWELVSRLS